jgi:hypothetical protein
MGERRQLKLTGANRAKAYKGIEVAIKKGVEDGKPWTLELRERTRTDEQNDALHGLIDQILKVRPTLNGVRMDKVTYKATFMQALGHELRMLPTLDGTGFFPLGLSTSRLTVSEFTDLIEFVLAWCAEQDIPIKHFDGDGKGSGSGTTRPEIAA